MVLYLMTSGRDNLVAGFSTAEQEFKGRPRALEYLSGIITDLFVDWHKFKGDEKSGTAFVACQDRLY